jgi:hydrogenase expression/formation protein HypD
MLLTQMEQKVTRLEVQYRPGIRQQGNPMSRQKIESVFDFEDVTLPDLGLIQRGRFVVKKEFAQYIT